MRKLFLTTLLLTSMTTLVFANDNGNGNGNGNIGSENGNNNGNGNVGNGSASNSPPGNSGDGGAGGSTNRIETARNYGGCSGGDRNSNSDDRCCVYFKCIQE